MTNKTDILQDILFSINDDEQQELDKIATDANTVTTTENSEAVKTIKKETPHKAERTLGLASLKTDSFQDDIRTLANIQPNKKDGLGTENISIKKQPVEPGSVFEKKASERVIAEIYEAAGVDLTKTASEEHGEDMLLKVAEQTLAEMQDLDKVAESLAEATADKFMAAVALRTDII